MKNEQDDGIAVIKVAEDFIYDEDNRFYFSEYYMPLWVQYTEFFSPCDYIAVCEADGQRPVIFVSYKNCFYTFVGVKEGGVTLEDFVSIAEKSAL